MFAGIVVGAVVYIVLIFALGAITKSDIMLIPKGEKVLAIWDRMLGRKKGKEA